MRMMSTFKAGPTMSRQMLPRVFLSQPLQNGVSRYTCQLKRVTLKFCKFRPGSLGAREFIESGEFVEFARANPEVACYLKPRRNRAPVLQAEYANGMQQLTRVDNFPVDQVRKWLWLMRGRCGDDLLPLHEPLRAFHASVQGVWTPFTFGRSGAPTGPDMAELQHRPVAPSATELIEHLYERQARRLPPSSSS